MNKLVIVGAEPRTRGNAPWEDSNCDIWTISNWANADWAKRVSAVVEIHKPELYKQHPLDDKYWDWLQNGSVPVYMQAVDPLVPSAQVYPLDDVLSMLKKLKVNGKDARPLNSSIAFALSLGILMGYKEIDVFGVEMSNSSEYRSQQPIFAFWVGFAAGRGVKLNINCTQDLFIQPLYGYEDMLNNEKLHSYINGLKEQQAEVLRQNHMIEGALQLARQLLDG